jgi:hypothetical protein
MSFRETETSEVYANTGQQGTVLPDFRSLESRIWDGSKKGGEAGGTLVVEEGILSRDCQVSESDLWY